MGNLAVKCESQWPTKKRVGVDVRVMRADGKEAQEFDRPVVVAEVMYQFPDYVVVQWFPNRNPKLGKRGQLRVLQRYEVLTPGQIYFLFPIPAEVARHKRSDPRISRRMQTSKDRMAQLMQRSEELQAKESEGSQEPNPPFPGFNGWELTVGNAAGGEVSAEETEGFEEDPKRYLHPGFSNWRPALLSIPESPIGFHSIPGSPMTPIAFRLVSPRP